MSTNENVSQVVAEAIAVVVSHVPADKRETIQGILSSVAVAQYQAGYRDAIKMGLDTVTKAFTK
jgi:hypothetical protein